MKKTRGKLDPEALKCIFVRYSSTGKGYKCYHPAMRQLLVNTDVSLHESEAFFYNSKVPLQGIIYQMRKR